MHTTSLPFRPTLVLAVLCFIAGLVPPAALAQNGRHDLGALDGTYYDRGSLTRAQDSATYWFYLQRPGATVRINVQDFGGRLIDQATLYDAAGNVKADSRNRIGAAIGARGLSTGWHRAFLRSSKDQHQYGITIAVEAANERPDVGNNFNSAQDLGVVGDQPKAWANRVGPGDSADVYRFQLTRSLNYLEAGLAGARRGSATLELYAQVGGQAQLRSRAAASGSNTPILAERLPAGVYFARVTPDNPATGLQGTSYDLYLRSREIPNDPGGDIQNPWVLGGAPTRRPVAENVTPQIDASDAFRFSVGPTAGGNPTVNVGVNGSSADFAIYLLDATTRNFLANDTQGGAQKRISQVLAPGAYHVFVITQGTARVDYQLSIGVQGPAPSIPVPSVPRPPRPGAPAPPSGGSLPRISYGGLLYTDHSGNTSMSPTTIAVNQSFTITSSSMRFAGPGTQVIVALELLDRIPGSFGVTRLQLTGVQVSGNRLIVRGPDQPIYGGGRRYRVVVVTYTNRQPDSYASPGVLTVR